MGHEKKRDKKRLPPDPEKKGFWAEKKEIRPDSALTAGSGDQKNHQKNDPQNTPKINFFGPFGPYFHFFRALRAPFSCFSGPAGHIFHFSGPAGPFTPFFGPCGAFYSIFSVPAGPQYCPGALWDPRKKKDPQKKRDSMDLGPRSRKKKGNR